MTSLDRTFVLLLLLFTVSMASLQPERSPRNKRSLWELSGVIKCSTGRSAFSYVLYGCYCGRGGQGWPKDGTDRCCHEHDCCYGYAESLGCYPKTDMYWWTCKHGQAECGWRNDICETILCQCDRKLAKCLRNEPFSLYYALWSSCGYTSPTCDKYNFQDLI